MCGSIASRVLAFELIGKGGASMRRDVARGISRTSPVANGDSISSSRAARVSQALELLLGKTPSAVECRTEGVNIVKARCAELTEFKRLRVHFGGKYDSVGVVLRRCGLLEFLRRRSGRRETARKGRLAGWRDRVRLWIPAKEKGVWCPYRFAVNLDDGRGSRWPDGTAITRATSASSAAFRSGARLAFTCEQVGL